MSLNKTKIKEKKKKTYDEIKYTKQNKTNSVNIVNHYNSTIMNIVLSGMRLFPIFHDNNHKWLWEQHKIKQLKNN